MPSWTEYEWLLKSRRGAEYMAARAPLVNRFYWKYVPTYYRWTIRRRIQSQFDFNTQIRPLKIVAINPDLVSLFSGREDANVDRWVHIGQIRGGDWDKRPPTSVLEETNTVGFSSAERIENTLLYKAIYNRVNNNVQWKETELVREAFSRIEAGNIALRSETKAKALERCAVIDQLIDQIAEHGYKTQFELTNSNRISSDRVGYLDVLTDEITVDIARDGTVLFVDGRHRLCIAKAMDLSTVPVVILVRHKKWMEKREELATNSGIESSHPDLPSETI